jgi:hypothetical protein
VRYAPRPAYGKILLNKWFRSESSSFNPNFSSRSDERTQIKKCLSPPPVQWSRDVQVTDYQFTRSTAQYLPSGDVTITQNPGKLEVIAIANDWTRGEELFEKKESHYDSGFIGRGYSKRGIYI